MILELAIIDIKPDKSEEFESVLEAAKAVIRQSKGLISVEFNRCLETPGKYVLLNYWETLEDHTVGFRESDLFVQWRAIIGPYFNTSPLVDHHEII